VMRWLSDDYVPLLLLIGASLLLIFTGCAEVAPPPGGEIDKLNPILIGSVPENGAVNVSPSRSITLFFSERIVEPRTGKAVFISPRPSKEPKLKWKSDRLEIIFPDSFRANETYIVSLSANITDLRGNKLDSSTVIAFSTGPSIDSGYVAGYAYSDDKALSGLMVALYRASIFGDTTVIFDSLYPDYLTQSNKEGWFTFQYLPTREFRLVVFDDKNRDERFNPVRESFALPDRRIIIGGEMPLDNLQLSLTTQDTATSEIISAAFTSDGLLKLRLSREIPLDLLRQNPSNIILRNQDDSALAYAAFSFLESDEQKASILNCYFGQLENGMYNLELTYDISKPTIYHRGIEVKHIEDKSSPAIVSFYPDKTPRFLDKIEIQVVFSEPLDTVVITDGTFILRRLPNVEVPLEHEWRDVFHLLLRPSELKEGTSYMLAITEFEIADLAGNVLGDSLREYPFSILDSDSLGSVSGDIIVKISSEENSPVVLSFKKVSADQVYDLSVSGRKFKIDIPAGKYLLSGFMDSDLDGQKDNGSIYPFQLAETSASYPDTIRVRARFETAEIRFEFK